MKDNQPQFQEAQRLSSRIALACSALTQKKKKIKTPNPKTNLDRVKLLKTEDKKIIKAAKK